MQRPHLLLLSKRNFIILLTVISIIFLFVLANITLRAHATGNTPPREMLETGLARTIGSDSFRYRAETKINTEGKENTDFISSIEGERAAPDQIKISGVIMNTPIDLIQIGESSYFKDQPSGRWISLDGNKISDMEVFYAELNPLAYFNFQDIPELKYKGTAKTNGARALLMELRPLPADLLLNNRLTDLSYKIWLDPKDYRIQQALIQAKDKNSPQSSIEINLSFWDYDKNISITAPDVN